MSAYYYLVDAFRADASYRRPGHAEALGELRREAGLVLDQADFLSITYRYTSRRALSEAEMEVLELKRW